MTQEISPQLQQILNRFGRELEAYIQNEVKLQINKELNNHNSTPEGSQLTSVIAQNVENPLEDLQKLIGNLPQRSSTSIKSDVIQTPEESHRVMGVLGNTAAQQYQPNNEVNSAFTLLDRFKQNRVKN